VPLEAVIEFKRGVYQLALLELSRLLFRDRIFDIPESYRSIDLPVEPPEAPPSS